MASYDIKAILGDKLKRLTDRTLKALVDCMCTVAASLCSLEKRISALESVEIPEGGYKPMQEPVASPTASGTAIQFIESLSQDATGRMTATKMTVRTTSTSQTGVVQLTDSHSSISTSTAATPKNVKEAYDLANGKADPASVVDSATYDSSSHTIVFKHGSTQLFTLDAAAFVKDGMVDSVAISNGNLVITFNTDAGKQPISITLTDIFNPNNYYTKSATDILLASKVDSTDSRLLPNADVFVATYTEQAAGTTMEELEAARTAGKKIYVNVGGSMSGESNIYEKMIPLTYVRFYNGNVTGYFFETSIDSLVSSSDSGKITTYWRAANGWGHTTSEVKYAETAGTANEATNAKGYVEGYGIAQGLASKMSTTASNAATEALDNLMTKLGLPSSSDAIAELTTIMAVSYNGTNWKQLRPGTLWNYIKSKVDSAGYATVPRLAMLDNPAYYQGGSAVEYITVWDKNSPAGMGVAQILGNQLNTSTKWGVCHVPSPADYSKGYCEIEFDLQLWSYKINDSQTEVEPYANLDMPYIFYFVATTMSNDGASPANIPLTNGQIFATTTQTIDAMRGTTASFAHVRLGGRLQTSTSSNHAIYIGAQGGNDWAALRVRAKMVNVRVKFYNDMSGMT
jgi:hypothetical protein